MSPRKGKFTDTFEDEPNDLVGMPPSTYSLSSDATVVVDQLMTAYPEQLGHLRNYRIALLRRNSSRTDNEFDVQGAGGAFVRADRERGMFPGFDAGIWFQGKWWDQFTPHQRKAWLHGYLLRLGIAPKGGRLKLLRPEVVEWASVVRIYGAWQPTLELFAHGLDDHERSGAGEAADGAVVRRLSAVPPPPPSSTTQPH